MMNMYNHGFKLLLRLPCETSYRDKIRKNVAYAVEISVVIPL